MSVCITGATGFIGAHLAELASQSLGPVRVTYRDESRLDRLGSIEVEPVRADVLDRAALRRAFRGCETVFHAAGYVASRPVERVWEVNALSPRIVVEAAAAEDVRRVVVTSSVAGIGPAPLDRPGTEDDPYLGGGLGLAYPDAKHEGESEALAAGARLGVEVVVVNPSYVFGPGGGPQPPGRDLQPADRQLPAGPPSRRGGLGDERGGRARRGGGPPARGFARGARRALRAGRPRPALGRSDRARGAAVGGEPRAGGAAARGR